MRTMSSDETERMVTTDDVAAALNISRSAVLLWIRAGKLPAIQTPGREYRIRKSVLDRILQGEQPNPG